MDKGYLILAENSPSGNYLEMAYCLAMSIKITQSTVNQVAVLVTPGTEIPEKYRQVFDHIIELPWLDNNEDQKWKVRNKWKIIHASPWTQTIFLDADMLLFRDVSPWWNILQTQDLWFSTNPLNYQGNPFQGDFYRRVFTANQLPDIYNCFFYFKKTPETFEFFEIMKLITWNWTKFEYEFLSEKRPKHYSGDVAFALALKLSGNIEAATNNYFDIPRFIHMRSHGQGWNLSTDKQETLQEDWTRYVPVHFTPDLKCFVGGYRILEPFHYHVKSFLTPRIIEYYEDQI